MTVGYDRLQYYASLPLISQVDLICYCISPVLEICNIFGKCTHQYAEQMQDVEGKDAGSNTREDITSLDGFYHVADNDDHDDNDFR